MRELICGLIMGLSCGFAIGAWLHAKMQEVPDDMDDRSE